MADETVEACVIGSGFGGAIAALRLAKAGVKTVVLERGKEWKITNDHNTFCTYRNPDGRAAWLSNTTVLFAEKPIEKFTGILERKIGDGITVWCAAGVGGGSLVYNTVLLKPTREIFNQTYGKYGYKFEDLDPYYQTVEKEMGPSPIPDDVLQADDYLSTRVFMKNAELAKIPVARINIASDWDVVRKELAGKIPPAAIAGEIWYGINSGCKKSLDTNYLPRAVHTGNCTVRPLHNVTKISEGKDGGFVVSYNVIDTHGNVTRQGTIYSKMLFMGAGSINTSDLLVRAKATNTLPKLNEHVGKFWGNNGDSFATREVGVETNYDRGGPASAAIKHYDNKFSPVTLIVYPEWDAPTATLTSLGMTIAEPLGEFTYNAADNSVKLTWPANDPRLKNVLDAPNETYRLLDAVLPELQHGHKHECVGKDEFHGHGCRPGDHQKAHKEHEKTQASAAVTAHPCGGVVMTKACDSVGRVKGYKGLYVVDGAFIPGCTAACNPAFTIAAFAERNMDFIIKEDVRLHS